MTRLKIGVLLAVMAMMGACAKAPDRPAESDAAPARPIGAVKEIIPPVGLPPVPVPANNPPTRESIQLGRRLFYDPGLSADRTVSCGTCHDPQFGFSDGKPVSTGVEGKKGKRNAPTVWNAAYNLVQFWDGRAASLEEQAAGPMENPVEMAHTLQGVEERLNDDSSYVAEFQAAFGPGRVTIEKIKMALASFERTVLTGNSMFDKYMYRRDTRAMGAPALRGLEVFRNEKKGNCAACHIIEKEYALFTDHKFHNLGVGLNAKGELTDLGRFEVTKQDADRGAFKTPTLRNLTQSGPYMHDGSLTTLRQVVDFYVGGGNSNDHLDPLIKPLSHLTQQERTDLVVFLQTLTGEPTPDVGPQ